jgi:hypothetical protein
VGVSGSALAVGTTESDELRDGRRMSKKMFTTEDTKITENKQIGIGTSAGSRDGVGRML